MPNPGMRRPFENAQMGKTVSSATSVAVLVLCLVMHDCRGLSRIGSVFSLSVTDHVTSGSVESMRADPSGTEA